MSQLEQIRNYSAQLPEDQARALLTKALAILMFENLWTQDEALVEIEEKFSQIT